MADQLLRGIALAAALSCGCAMMTSSAPRTNLKPSEVPKCSSNRLGMAVDVIFSVLWGGVALSALSDDNTAVALPFGLLATLQAGTAAGGHNWATKCEAAVGKHDRWVAQLSHKRNREAQSERKVETTPDVRRTRARPKSTLQDPWPSPTDKPRTSAPATRRPTKRVPLPGTDGWREFWREVSP